MLVTDAPFSRATIDDYRRLVGDDRVEAIRVAAEGLRGARVLHVNATAVGGGVAEMLLSLIPLMREAGLETDWYVLRADDRFFEVTKSYAPHLAGYDLLVAASGVRPARPGDGGGAVPLHAVAAAVSRLVSRPRGQ